MGSSYTSPRILKEAEGHQVTHHRYWYEPQDFDD